MESFKIVRKKPTSPNINNITRGSLYFYIYHAFISLKSDKCLPFIFIGWSDFSGGVLSIFTGCESAVELRVEKSYAII